MKEQYVKPIILFVLIGFFVALAVFVWGNQPAGEPAPTLEPPTAEPPVSPVSPLPPPVIQDDEFEAQVIPIPQAEVFTNTLTLFYTIPDQPPEVESPLVYIVPETATLSLLFEATLTDDAGQVLAIQNQEVPHGLIQATEPPTGTYDIITYGWQPEQLGNWGDVTETVNLFWQLSGICVFPPEGGACVDTPLDPVPIVYLDANNQVSVYTRTLELPGPVYTIYLPVILR